MKIVIISPSWPYRGGIAQYADALCSKLRKEHRVFMITFDRQYPNFLFPGKSQFCIPVGQGVVNMFENTIDSINPLNWIGIAKKINDWQPDLVIFSYWMAFFAPCFGVINRLLKAKVIFLCHNIISHEKRIGDAMWAKFSFKGASFIVQSKQVEKELLQIVPDAKYELVPHPLYEQFGTVRDKYAARIDLGINAEKMILCFGLVKKYKGIEILVEAARKLPHIEFYVVGENYGCDLPKADNVIYVDEFVSNDVVNTYFSASDMVVLPYKTASQSGVVKIAYQLDRFCIVSNALKDEVEEGRTGYVTDDFAGAITRYYDEQPEFDKSVKERYSWDNVVEAIDRFFVF